MITIPDETLFALNGETARHILEQFALEAYKSDQLSHAQLARLLGFETPMEVDGFLKEHKVFFDYDEEELAREEETSRHLNSLRKVA